MTSPRYLGKLVAKTNQWKDRLIPGYQSDTDKCQITFTTTAEMKVVEGKN
jgi:hypothetical protein